MLGAPTRDRAAERRAATRLEILEAAWALSRERGLLDWTMRDVGDLVGMRAPSLYSHFESKLAIYDAMFEQAWSEYERAEREAMAAEDPTSSPRTILKSRSHLFFDFAVADLARYQLMNQRSVPGFTPSPESFAPSRRVVQLGIDLMASMGVRDRGDVEIWIALLSGLVDQQLANEPGGHSRKDLIDRAIDMWADAVGMEPKARSKGRRTR
jgi:AcrR family transcriptional regulator